jgi:hypothetical protein
VNEREVIGPFSLVTNEQPAEEVMPAIGSLDDPPARLSTHASDERLFASPSDVWDDASIADFAQLRPRAFGTLLCATAARAES